MGGLYVLWKLRKQISLGLQSYQPAGMLTFHSEGCLGPSEQRDHLGQ